MRVSVFGLGYVGSVSLGCLASTGHSVIGVDVNPNKVNAINRGSSPILECGMEELMRAGHAKGAVRATTSAGEAIEGSDLSLLCVGTPSQANGGLDLRHVVGVCEEIGKALRSKRAPHTVVLRSTVIPGTCESVVIPVLERTSGKVAGRHFDFCFNPEFLREGSSIHDFHHPPKIVVGSDAPDPSDLVLALYAGIEAPRISTSLRVAEMVKYADNAFHALKVAFANEIGSLSKAFGIDSHEVMSIFCRDSKLNLSSAYLTPGFAFGGSCLPKDLRALTHQSRRFDLEVPVLDSILRSNALQVRRLTRRILELGHKRVGFLGMSFKVGTDDLRESPLVEVIESLLGKGYSVQIHDADVSLSRLVGANREYIERHLPHLSSLLVDDMHALLETSDVVVLGHGCDDVLPALRDMRPGQHVIDLVRIAPRVETSASYEGISW